MGGFEMGRNVLTLGTSVSGLIIWNVVALLAVWLFAALFNGIKSNMPARPQQYRRPLKGPPVFIVGRIVLDVRTIIQEQKEYIYIPDFAPRA
jgi:hypothetical protein